jgi:hypothetical protein
MPDGLVRVLVRRQLEETALQSGERPRRLDLLHPHLASWRRVLERRFEREDVGDVVGRVVGHDQGVVAGADRLVKGAEEADLDLAVAVVGLGLDRPAEANAPPGVAQGRVAVVAFDPLALVEGDERRRLRVEGPVRSRRDVEVLQQQKRREVVVEPGDPQVGESAVAVEKKVDPGVDEHVRMGVARGRRGERDREAAGDEARPVGHARPYPGWAAGRSPKMRDPTLRRRPADRPPRRPHDGSRHSARSSARPRISAE